MASASKIVVLKLGSTDSNQEMSVTLQILGDGLRPLAETTGSLPSAPKILENYQNWKSAYNSQGKNLRLEAPVKQNTNFSITDLNSNAQNLEASLNNWLNSQQLRAVREKLREKITPEDEVRVLIQTEDRLLQRLPWHLWEFFDRYRKAEVAISLLDYQKLEPARISRDSIRILAILGNSKGINIEADRRLLENFPNTETIFLVEPQRRELHEYLWDKQGWDILFFAGHSSSQGQDETGRIYINQTDSLTLKELKSALNAAISQGLHLAIFNSCDGIGLARALAVLNIPQVIVMREPVPDLVAQEFLKYFLQAFTSGQSLYLAVREARERLQGLEYEFPCATWLPAIVQNPAEIPKTWQQFLNVSSTPVKPKSRLKRFNRQDVEVKNLLLDDVKSEVEIRLESSLHNAVLINLVKEQQPEQVSNRWDVEIKIGSRPSSLLPTNIKILEALDLTSISGKLLLLGEPGAGKTTTLLELARDLIARAEVDADEPIPVLFNLSSWKKENDNVFDLFDPSSWKKKNRTLADWMISELKLKHGVRKDIAKKLLEKRQLTPLLDGLDEVDSTLQEQCIKAINQFQQDYRPDYLVVCCRRAEYKNLQTQLQLNGAIYLSPLTERQIYDYLVSVNCLELWQSIRTSPELLELAKSPLLLSIMSLVSQDISFQEWLRIDSAEEQRRYLFDAYISRMLSRRTKRKWYASGKEPTPEQTKRWLAYLARMLKQESQTEFLIENMQPTWLTTRTQKKLYRALLGLSFGLIIGFSQTLESNLSRGVSVGLENGLIWSPIVGLIMGLIRGTINALTGGLFLGLIGWVSNNKLFWKVLNSSILVIFFIPILLLTENNPINQIDYISSCIIIVFFPFNLAEKIRIFETLKCSWMRAKKTLFYSIIGLGLILTIYTFFYLWIYGYSLSNVIDESTSIVENILFILIVSIVISSFLALIIGIPIGMLFAITSLNVERKITPNQGIIKTAKNIVTFVLFGEFILGGVLSIVLGLLFILVDQGNLIDFQYLDYLDIFLIAILSFMIYGTLIPAFSVVQHFALRVILYWQGFIPWNYAHFLNYATERLFLQRIGGRYKFIHDFLREHLALIRSS